MISNSPAPVGADDPIWIALRNRVDQIAERYRLHGDADPTRALRGELFAWLRAELCATLRAAIREIREIAEGEDDGGEGDSLTPWQRVLVQCAMVDGPFTDIGRG